jgi:hypothetical protein
VATRLPSDYLAFLRHANGGEGFLGENYAMLWRAGEFVQFNVEYGMPELAGCGKIKQAA